MFEQNLKGLSKNFSTAYGYRSLLIHQFHADRVAELHLMKIENGKTYIAKPVEIIWEAKNHGDWTQKPFLVFNEAEEEDRHGATLLQSIQSLFQQGKSVVGTFMEGELEGTKKHLEDMRQLVFKGEQKNENK